MSTTQPTAAMIGALVTTLRPWDLDALPIGTVIRDDSVSAPGRWDQTKQPDGTWTAPMRTASRSSTEVIAAAHRAVQDFDIRGPYIASMP